MRVVGLWLNLHATSRDLLLRSVWVGDARDYYCSHAVLGRLEGWVGKIACGTARGFLPFCSGNFVWWLVSRLEDCAPIPFAGDIAFRLIAVL